MRVAWAWVLLATWLPHCSSATERGGIYLLHAQAGDARSLEQELLALTAERLLPSGVTIDLQHSSLSLSGPLPATGTFQVRPAWSAPGTLPPLPLTFEVRPDLAGDMQLVRATLAVRLLQEVLVAARRLDRGSAVACADLKVARRDVRNVPKLALQPKCALNSELVMLRDVAAGDLLRSTDVGSAPDVAAGMPVRLSVAQGAIVVTTNAISLADASVGDRIEVRLQRPTRTLKARVTAPGSAQLEDVRP